MRSHLALVVALSLVPAVALADRDPFATRRPPPGSVAPEPAKPAEPAESAERVVVIETDSCDCEDGTISRLTAARITGATGLALGLGTLALGLYERNRFLDAAERGDYETADEAQNVLRYAGTGMFAAGAVMVGVSIYLYATMPESRRTIVAPVVGQDELGVALAHSF